MIQEVSVNYLICGVFGSSGSVPQVVPLIISDESWPGRVQFKPPSPLLRLRPRRGAFGHETGLDRRLWSSS